MNQDIASYVNALPVIDVHEHHMPSVLRNPDVGLIQLLNQSYASWPKQRPYPLPSETRGADPMLEPARGGSWADVAAIVERSANNSFVRNIVAAVDRLYDLGGGGIHEGNWERVDTEIRRRHAEPGWVDAVLERAGIRRIITDPFEDPLMDCRETLGARYQSVCRINSFAFGYHPGAKDHNGNSAHAFAARLGRPMNSFDDFLKFCEYIVDTLVDRHQVALKNALAYDRSLDFDDVDMDLAKKAWGNPNPSPAEKKAFGDVAVDHLCGLAGERDVPVQVHLGSAIIRESHPMLMAGLIERHPKTRFLLMHLAYPWSQDLFGLAFVYRNVWLDLTWSFLLSPSRFVRDLHEAIEITPDMSRLMFGGDNWHAEETFGAVNLARQLIDQVLEEKVSAGYFGTGEAKRLAEGILYQNAIDFFGLSPLG